VLVEALAVGICGPYAEIAEGGYEWSPPGHDRLILAEMQFTFPTFTEAAAKKW
jgi:hypothetical protein